MKKFYLILNSTIFMVLFYFSDLYSLPLTRSCYTPPEDIVDLSLREELLYTGKVNRKDVFAFNLGLPYDNSIGFDFSVIHYEVSDTGMDIPGDILFNFWHYTGDYFNGFFKTGFGAVMRIPTGPDAYTDERYRNLSLGNSELKITPVVSVSLSGQEVFVLNFSYVFREAGGESIYDGFNINPAKSETYESCFGLNPFYRDSFLYHEKLKNDYVSVSGGLLTSRFSPFVLFTELYCSTGIYKWSHARQGGDIEGNRTYLKSSAGVKYFFSGSFYMQVAEIADILQRDGIVKNTVELTLNIFF